MISTSIGDGGGLDRIIDRLGRYKSIDLAPLARTIGQIVEEDTRAGIGAGTGPDGALAPLAESTLRRRKGRGAAPGGGPSGSLASDLTVALEPNGSGVDVVIGWRGETARKALYFTHGTSRQPARNIQGLRPESRERIRQAAADFLARVGDAS